MARMAIIGLGLIGTSIGLALKQNARADLTIVGSDRDGMNASRAKKRGAVDATEWSAAAAVRDAELVVIATPIIAVRQVMQEIAPTLREGAIVTDTASVKGAVLGWAAAALPDHAWFVGGHPMAGGDRTGPDAASAKLFVDERDRPRPFIIVPPSDAPDAVVRTMIGFVGLLGAEPVFMDAREHDALIAGVSHMPLLLSIALFSVARNSPAWNDMAPLAGPAFRELTRLAKGSPEMALDIFENNRENLAHWLDRLQSEIGRYREMLQGDEKPLHEELVRMQLEREVFEEVEPKRGEPSMPGASDHFLTLLAGERVVERTKQIFEAVQSDPSARRVEQRERQRDDTNPR